MTQTNFNIDKEIVLSKQKGIVPPKWLLSQGQILLYRNIPNLLWNAAIIFRLFGVCILQDVAIVNTIPILVYGSVTLKYKTNADETCPKN